jgi:hypothetical protein
MLRRRLGALMHNTKEAFMHDPKEALMHDPKEALMHDPKAALTPDLKTLYPVGECRSSNKILIRSHWIVLTD